MSFLIIFGCDLLYLIVEKGIEIQEDKSNFSLHN